MIRIGPYEIYITSRGKFWIRKDGGEAMQTSEEKLIAMIDVFWKEEI